MDTFSFCQNMYLAKVQYGFAVVDVYVSITRTKYGCDCEELMVYAPHVFDKHVNHARNTAYYGPSDPISQMYSQWDLVLNQKLTDHLLVIVDKLLEKLEIETYRRKKNEWRRQRLAQGLFVR